MAINRNSNTAEEIRDVFKLQQNVDGIISNVAGQIIPVVDVNPKHARIIDVIGRASLTNGTSATMLTIPDDRDFYCMGASLSMIKDVAAINTLTAIAGTLNGATVRLLDKQSITLTADSSHVSISFPFPIKLDRGTTVVLTSDNAGATIRASAAVYGFYLKNERA